MRRMKLLARCHLWAHRASLLALPSVVNERAPTVTSLTE